MKPSSLCLIIIVSTFVLRCCQLSIFYPPSGWSDVGFGFELGNVARNLYEGRGFSSPFGEGSRPTAWFMPFTPLLWCLIFKAVGLFSDASLLLIYLLQIGARSCAAGLYFLIAKRISKNDRVSVIAALSTALLPDHFVMMTRPWYWAFQELGVALTLHQFLIWPEVRFKNGVTLALAITATLLVNSVPVLLFIPVILGHLIIHRGNAACVKATSLVLIMVAGALSPWVARNYVTGGSFVPLRANSWIELRQGNNPNGSIIQGLDSVHPNVDARERLKYESMGESAYSEFAAIETLTYVSRYPQITAKRTFLRGILFWFCDLFHEGVYGDKEWGGKDISEKITDVFHFFAVFVPLSMCVLAVCIRRLLDVEGMWLLLAPLLFLPIPYYLSHIHPTYLAAVKPYLVLVGVVGIWGVRSPLKDRGKGETLDVGLGALTKSATRFPQTTASNR